MNIFILKEIGKYDKSIWKLFSLLNKEMNRYFNVRKREYEIAFREIKKYDIGTWYYLDGKCHRSDGPAIIRNNGDKMWCCNGQYHRLDGPAIIRNNGDKMWCCNGQYHRLDGPAVIYINCVYEWRINDKRHRTNGPAVEYVEDDKKKYNEWWIDGERVMKDDESDERE